MNSAMMLATHVSHLTSHSDFSKARLNLIYRLLEKKDQNNTLGTLALSVSVTLKATEVDLKSTLYRSKPSSMFYTQVHTVWPTKLKIMGLTSMASEVIWGQLKLVGINLEMQVNMRKLSERSEGPPAGQVELDEGDKLPDSYIWTRWAQTFFSQGRLAPKKDCYA